MPISACNFKRPSSLEMVFLNRNFPSLISKSPLWFFKLFLVLLSSERLSFFKDSESIFNPTIEVFLTNLLNCSPANETKFFVFMVPSLNKNVPLEFRVFERDGLVSPLALKFIFMSALPLLCPRSHFYVCIAFNGAFLGFWFYCFKNFFNFNPI